MSTEATQGRPTLTQAEDMFDSLADLFLGDDQHRQSTPGAAIQLRGLIVGHLPVMASAWISQHARDLSQSLRGPVAVITRAGGHITLDLHGTTDRIPQAKNLDDAITDAMNAGVRAWLLRADAISEFALAESTALTGLSILTGHDEAALVAAYRALKGLTSGSEFEPVVPEIHVAVLGATDDQGRPAAEKLRRAAESFLQTGLASVTITQKVNAGSAARLLDIDSDLDIDELINRLPTEHPRPSLQTAADPARLRLARGDNDHASRIGPVETHPAQVPLPETVAAVRPQRPATDSTHANPEAQPMRNASHLAPMLGLKPLEPRCPYADEVELAADSEGRAHLIIHAEGASHSLANALESLEIARAWLAAHLTILAAATASAVRVSPPLDPACHLIVDHAAGARRLLDSDTHLYVLAQGRSESLCVPLN